jgi:inorganic pyrophosphatase
LTAVGRRVKVAWPVTETSGRIVRVDVDVMIEVPKGSRNKYQYDPAIDGIRLDRMLFTSTGYPGDYGFAEQAGVPTGVPA